MTNAINLSLLPVPDVVQPLDYENILASLLQDLRRRSPDFTALVESDPAYKILEVVAYRELLLRQRINDAARSVMLAYAKGRDLDHLAALFGLQRQVIDPGHPDAVPPVPVILEDDERFRQRIPLSLEGYSTAGPVGAYIYQALKASGQVKDVSVSSPHPGQVRVTVLSTQGNGVPSSALLEKVKQHLHQEDVRPLTDQVIVQGAQITEYQVTAHLTCYPGPDMKVVARLAREKVQDYVQQHHQLGHEISLSALYAALHQVGVQKVSLRSPRRDHVMAPDEAPFCTAISITQESLHASSPSS